MKKIMFDDKFGLTEAVLQGRKTMTRRFIKQLLNVGNPDISDWGLKDGGKAMITLYEGGRPTTDIFPMYQPGEVVAVAQNYNDVYEVLKRTHGSSSRVTREFFHKYVQGGRMPVSNKMFVRADLMPHRIRITDIKVERIQDISNEDCFNEGVRWDYADYPYMNEKTYYFTPYEGFESPRMAFSKLINRICGQSTWERNPWVFCYSFELIK